MQKIVNIKEKFPKIISRFVDLKINLFTTKSLSNWVSKIKDKIIINVLTLGLKFFTSSHNPIVKKIIYNNKNEINLFIGIKESKNIRIVDIDIVKKIQIPPINGVGVLWIFLLLGRSTKLKNLEILFL